MIKSILKTYIVAYLLSVCLFIVCGYSNENSELGMFLFANLFFTSIGIFLFSFIFLLPFYLSQRKILKELVLTEAYSNYLPLIAIPLGLIFCSVFYNYLDTDSPTKWGMALFANAACTTYIGLYEFLKSCCAIDDVQSNVGGQIDTQ